ncbi:M6 family metalloprotease domain-containing protein [Bacillus sp. AGMB 02131]|uniref:M6 family metalloprotease domain-containing protein n=1 Tax=Peribacillus faecalis TaxID=2772559 RepID=A0A927D0A8_9BACI|nr:M6 family metalloprotease domain-containing protein [Peribacillus faecalis]MBD3108674.1 M6 family metalloprotease domain-containing protein [Peribacillus faecalis]
MKLRNKITAITTGILLAMSSTAAFAAQPGLDKMPDPIDPLSWVNPEDMTWNDYNPIPGIDWNNTDIKPETELKGALILVDFPDQDFILTKAKGSELIGNPQVDAVPREELGEWWKDFLNTPSELNNYQTIDGFWKENSNGKWGVTLDSYGPYRLDKNEFQYGLESSHNANTLPSNYTRGNLFQDGVNAAAADIAASGEEYDFAFIVHAGYDESTVWQELGEMMFLNPESVPDEFGPPDLPGFGNMPNWAKTRYVPWTSYYAAKTIWSAASSATINGKRIRVSIQGESDGMGTFAHEFGHLRGLGDNYNNAALDPRTYSGYWETMSRGSFNGPGGTHTRWMIPSTLGASLSAPHMLRNKMKQGFLENDEVLHINRDDLKVTGPVFADITARQVPIGSEFGRTGLYGINISMNDLTPTDYLAGDWRNDILNNRLYDNYTIEVVDRIGTDSFAADSGVLIAKTKNAETAPNIWVVDSHPEDIDLKDFTRPDGTTAMVGKGDPRQALDALFKAGSGASLVAGKFDGSINRDTIVSEYIDPYNKLHFYILGNYKDNDGVLRYQVAVRNTEGGGTYKRGVEVSAGAIEPAVQDKIAVYHFKVTNTGEEKDLIRVNASAGDDWLVQLDNNVLAIEPGAIVDVPVYVKIPKGKTAPDILTFTATSETDSTQTVTYTNLLASNLNATGLSSVIDSFAKEGAFKAGAAQALKAHLNSVGQFEKKNSPDKVLKHINNFKQFLELKKDANQISEKAYNSLKAHADAMIEIWQ